MSFWEKFKDSCILLDDCDQLKENNINVLEKEKI
jgi:hypothetical protein